MKMKFYLIILIALSSVLLKADSAFAEENTRTSSAVLFEEKTNTEPDNRAKVLKKYFERYNSPLANHAETFIEEADKNKIDWKLVAAISGVESTFAQFLPYNSHNAWGWGIYGDNTHYFNSYDDAIQTISKGLRENYMNKWGASNVYEIGSFYAASPTWAQRVEHFMNSIDDLDKEMQLQTISISI